MKKAIVLGGTVPHIELIKQLQDRDFYVILLDYYDNPVAKEYADEHIQESTLDKEAVLKIAKDRNVDLVITTSIDQANITACYVMEKLGKKPPYSYETAKRICDKGDMKKTMLENQVPTSRYYYLEKDARFTEDYDLTFPIIVKPADSNSSKGVKVARSFDEAVKYVEEAKEISRTNRVIVEEFVDGPEASVYCFIGENDSHVLLISRRFSRVEGSEKAFKCYGTISNLEVSDKILERMKWSVETIAKAYGLKNTPFFMQVILKEDDISIIEFAPRTGGGMCFVTVPMACDINYIASGIDSFLETEFNCNPKQSKYIFGVNTLYGIDGTYDRIEGVNKLIEDGYIEKIFPIKTKGMEIKSGTASSERIAFLLIKGKTKEEVCEKAKKIVENIDVYDVDNNKILRKDIYLRVEDID